MGMSTDASVVVWRRHLRSLTASRRGRSVAGLLRMTGWMAAGLAIVVTLVMVTGADFTIAVTGWFAGAFGNAYGVTQTLLYAAPLTIVGLGVAPALRAGVISIGAEGQMIAGAILAAVNALYVAPGLPAWAALPLDAGAGVVGGALWAAAPAVAFNRLGVSVILFTLLTNYLAIDLLAWLLRTVMRDPAGAATPQSAGLPVSYLLPQLPVPGRLHAGAPLALVSVAVALWWRRTTSAFLVDVAGERPELAARCGLPRDRAVLMTMMVSGAAAGLAGWMQIAGVDGRLQPGTTDSIGFAGVAVAVLGRGHPLGILVAALLYASLTTGANGLEMLTGSVPASIGTVAQGVVLLSAALATARRTVRP
jgi:general nucleoside transport system permease protein